MRDPATYRTARRNTVRLLGNLRDWASMGHFRNRRGTIIHATLNRPLTASPSSSSVEEAGRTGGQEPRQEAGTP
jgi:hypothetical protein